MDGWIFQPGYPLVTAELREGVELVLTQQRFTYLPNPALSTQPPRPAHGRFRSRCES